MNFFEEKKTTAYIGDSKLSWVLIPNHISDHSQTPVAPDQHQRVDLLNIMERNSDAFLNILKLAPDNILPLYCTCKKNGDLIVDNIFKTISPEPDPFFFCELTQKFGDNEQCAFEALTLITETLASSIEKLKKHKRESG